MNTVAGGKLERVTGTVSNLKITKGKDTTWTIKLIDGRKFTILCDFYCPVRNNDIMVGICVRETEKSFRLKYYPDIEFSAEQDTIIQCFMKVSKEKYPVCKTLYDEIEAAAHNEQYSFNAYLDDLAEKWSIVSDRSLFNYFSIDANILSTILVWWHKECNLRKVSLLGLTKDEINACHMKCSDIYSQCMTNPYVLPPIPMNKCENMLKLRGKLPTKEQKYMGAIVRTIYNNLTRRFWSCTPIQYLKREYKDIDAFLDRLQDEYRLVFESDSLFLEHPYKVEISVAELVAGMLEQDTYVPCAEIDLSESEATATTTQKAFFRKELSPDQKMAVEAALEHKICLITGGAGTGKTTCLSELIHNLELRGINHAVCSFTGKAVSRIREVTGKKNARTIHKLISSQQGNKGVDFGSTTVQHIIIDECSMVQTELFYELMLRYPNVNRITLIGDIKQLEPIGWGSLFYQLIASKTVPTYYLSTNFRTYLVQGEVNGIILNANNMVSYHNDNGESRGPKGPFRIQPAENFIVREGAVGMVIDLVETLSKNCKSDEFIVLCPYNKVLADINEKIQKLCTAGNEEKTDTLGNKWVVGDRVMLKENDDNIEVYNGEIGSVVSVAHDRIWVDFGNGVFYFGIDVPVSVINHKYSTSMIGNVEFVNDGQEKSTLGRNTSKLQLAYALTVDKSQGSEWNYVIYYTDVITGGNFMNIKRNYTAITRAKRMMLLVTPDIDIFNSYATSRSAVRYEGLAKRMSAVLNKIEPYLMDNPAKYVSLLMKEDNDDIDGYYCEADEEDYDYGY